MNLTARTSNPTKGLTLVEIVVAIGVFSIVMLALSGMIVSGLQLRRKNNVDAQASVYAASILELYKNHYSTSANFDKGTSPVIPEPPGAVKQVVARIDTTITCIDVEGEVIAGADTSDADKDPCELRRVGVTVLDLEDKPRANFVTEVGKPLQ
ncbi:MAG: type IV pilus modification PilV family protein [Trueperaceae bacterium]